MISLLRLRFVLIKTFVKIFRSSLTSNIHRANINDVASWTTGCTFEPINLRDERGRISGSAEMYSYIKFPFHLFDWNSSWSLYMAHRDRRKPLDYPGRIAYKENRDAQPFFPLQIQQSSAAIKIQWGMALRKFVKFNVFIIAVFSLHFWTKRNMNDNPRFFPSLSLRRIKHCNCNDRENLPLMRACFFVVNYLDDVLEASFVIA